MDPKAFYETLKDLSQSDYLAGDHEGGATRLLDPRWAKSRNAKTCAYTALCVAQVLRLTAPNPPWDSRQQNAVLQLFLNVLDQLAPPAKVATADVGNQALVTELLALMTQMQLPGWIVEFEDKADAVTQLFEVGFRIAHCKTVPARARYLMEQLLTQLAEEFDGNLPDDALCLLLDQFNGPAFVFSLGIANNCPNLRQRTRVFFTELLGDLAATDRYNQALDLARGIAEHAFSLFEPSLPLFTDHLETQDSVARVMAVKVFGWSLCFRDDEAPRDHQDLSRWIKRSGDVSVSVRLAWAEAAGALLARPSLSGLDEQIRPRFEDCLQDSDSRVRAAACKELASFGALCSRLEQLLSPRLRDRSPAVRARALETAAALYETSWKNDSASWVASAVLNVIYIGEQQALSPVWATTLKLLGLEQKSDSFPTRRVLTTLSRLNSKSFKAFSTLFRRHSDIAKAVATLCTNGFGDSPQIVEWLCMFLSEPRLREHLEALTHEDYHQLKVLVTLDSRPLELYEALDALPAPVATLGLNCALLLEQGITSCVKQLSAPEFGQAAWLLLDEFAQTSPLLFKDAAPLLLDQLAGKNDYALMIVSTIHELTGALSEESWQYVEEQVFEGDPQIASKAVELIANKESDRLTEISRMAVAKVMDSPSVSLLSVLRVLYRCAPEFISLQSGASSIPKKLAKVVLSAKEADKDLAIESLRTLVTRLEAVARPSTEGQAKAAEPVLNLFRRVLQAGGDTAQEAATLWLGLASSYGKQTSFEDIILLEPFATNNFVGTLIKDLRSQKLSLAYSPLLFSNEAAQPLVKAGFPTFLKLEMEVALMAAYLVYFVAFKNASLTEVVSILKRFFAVSLTSSTIDYVGHMLERVKQFRDVRDPAAASTIEPTPESRRLYAVSELASRLLDRERKIKGWGVTNSFSPPMALPSRAYQSTASAAASSLVAETSYIDELGSPEEIEAVCGGKRTARKPLAPCRPKNRKSRGRKTASSVVTPETSSCSINE